MGGGSGSDFVRRQNLEKFRRRLASATDEAERRLLRKLLVEEECKAPSATGGSPMTGETPTTSNRHEP
jgi:hypothetical protein